MKIKKTLHCNIPDRTNLSIAEVEKIKLTAIEMLSLRRIQNPRRQKISSWQLLCRHVRDTSLDLLFLSGLLPGDRLHIPVLEGKTLRRSLLDCPALLAIGQNESFSHLPGVGTQWRLCGRTWIQREHRAWMRLLVCAFRLGKAPRKFDYLPLPPRTLDEEADFIEVVKKMTKCDL